MKDIGIIEVDIVYGGNFYVIIDVKLVGLELILENVFIIIDKVIYIRNIINEKFEIIYLEYLFIRGLIYVEFYIDVIYECVYVKNIVIVLLGGID